MLKHISSRAFSTTSCIRMKLLQFIKDGKQSIGVQRDDSKIVDLSEAEAKCPDNMVDFLLGGSQMLERAGRILSKPPSLLIPDQIKLISPITSCEKIICVGMNYKDHCIEQDVPIPDEPIIFNKFSSSIVGDGENVVIPNLSKSVDWEVELAVVIGKEGKNINKEYAFEYVAGYTIANDISARDWFADKNGKQWLLGKTFNTFCPLGPVLVTKDQIKDPHNLQLKCIVNGKEMQSSNTSQMVFGVDKIIEWISRFCSLKPGDVVLTGTPPGVGITRNPPVTLKPGDVVACEIEGIGRLTNQVVAED